MVGWGAMVANGWLEGIWTCVSRRLGQSYIDRSFGIAFIVYIINDDIISTIVLLYLAKYIDSERYLIMIYQIVRYIIYLSIM